MSGPEIATGPPNGRPVAGYETERMSTLLKPFGLSTPILDNPRTSQTKTFITRGGMKRSR